MWLSFFSLYLFKSVGSCSWWEITRMYTASSLRGRRLSNNMRIVNSRALFQCTVTKWSNHASKLSFWYNHINIWIIVLNQSNWYLFGSWNQRIFFRNHSTHLKIIITWCYHKPSHIPYIHHAKFQNLLVSYLPQISFNSFFVYLSSKPRDPNWTSASLRLEKTCSISQPLLEANSKYVWYHIQYMSVLCRVQIPTTLACTVSYVTFSL